MQATCLRLPSRPSFSTHRNSFRPPESQFQVHERLRRDEQRNGGWPVQSHPRLPAEFPWPNQAARERMCRRLSPRQISWKELFPRITIVNDPKKLAELNAEV